jgi:hypothetical protein
MAATGVITAMTECVDKELRYDQPCHGFRLAFALMTGVLQGAVPDELDIARPTHASTVHAMGGMA